MSENDITGEIERKRKSRKTTGLLGHVILIIGTILSIIIVTAFMKDISFILKVAVLWLILTFYLILTAKGKDGVMEKTKKRIERFEGKSMYGQH